MIQYKPTDPDLPSLEKQKEDILKYFNFDLVAMVMNSACRAKYDGDGMPTGEYYQWQIYNTNKGTLIQPTVEDLKQNADILLTDVIKNYRKNGGPLNYIGCGGYKACCRYGVLELEFVLESWSWDQQSTQMELAM